MNTRTRHVLLGLVVLALVILALCQCFTANGAEPIPVPASWEPDAAKWQEVLPADCYVQKHATGGLAGIHGRERGTLKGPSVVLYEGGGLRMLGGYEKAARTGTFRMWDREKRLILYAQFKASKPDGLVVVFKDATPWLIQEWKAGELRRESTDAPDAHARLAELGAELSAIDKETRKAVKDWWNAAEEERKAENVAGMKGLAAAQRAAGRLTTQAIATRAFADAGPVRQRNAARAMAVTLEAQAKAAAADAARLSAQATTTLGQRDRTDAAAAVKMREWAIKELEATR